MTLADFLVMVLKVKAFSAEKSLNDSRGFCLRCLEHRNIYCRETMRVTLADFPLAVLKVEHVRLRKVRVTLAEFAGDALEHVRDASVCRLAALRKSRGSVAWSTNLSGRARPPLAASGFS